MSDWTPAQQARRRAELADGRRPAPSAWSRDEQHQHRTVLVQALDGTEWHQPIPARRQASRRPRKASS